MSLSMTSPLFRSPTYVIRVGAQIPNIQIPNIFMFIFGMVWYQNYRDRSSSYIPDHSRTDPVQRNPKWQLFGQIWNHWVVWFCNAMQNPNPPRSKNFQPFEIQICLVFDVRYSSPRCNLFQIVLEKRSRRDSHRQDVRQP